MNDELKVYYSLGGKHFLLHWWSYDERGHVILSRTEAGIVPVARRVFEKHPDAEIRAYLEIDIVAPSKLHRSLAKALALQNEIELFYQIVVGDMRTLLEHKKTLPPPFVLCTNYETDEEEEVKKDEFAVEYHISCIHCDRTISLVGMTKTDFWEKYYPGWIKLFPSNKTYVDPLRVPSKAEEAGNDEKGLCCAIAAFGHHSSGIDLQEVDLDTNISYHPAFLTDRLIFLYRKVKELDRTELQSMLDERKKKAEEEKAKRDQAWKDKRKQEEEERIEKTIAFFSKENE